MSDKQEISEFELVTQKNEKHLESVLILPVRNSFEVLCYIVYFVKTY